MSKPFTQSRLRTLQIMLMSVVAVLTFLPIARAMLLPRWPIDYVVLKSQLIVQGHFIDEHSFLVDKVLLGNTTPLQQVWINDRMSLSNHPDSGSRSQAHMLLTEIVGRDLGKDKGAWFEWDKQNQPKQ